MPNINGIVLTFHAIRDECVKVDMRRCDFRDTTFTNCILEYSTVEDCTFNSAIFRRDNVAEECRFVNCSFRHCDLRGIAFIRCLFICCHFDESKRNAEDDCFTDCSFYGTEKGV